MKLIQITNLRWLWLIPFLAAAVVSGADVTKSNPPAKSDDSAGSCGKFGTQIAFVDTPSEAARQAAKEQKLVFVLHVSGLFEDPRLT
jgi:hypothetical protein